MLKSLPDALRSFWSKPANDSSTTHAAVRKSKRKLEDCEWDEDPDVQIVKFEQSQSGKRRKIDSIWRILNAPFKMAEWIRLKNKPFSEQFSTSASSHSVLTETKKNGASSKIPIMNGDKVSHLHRADVRHSRHGLNRGIVNGEHNDHSSNNSRLSDRGSSTSTLFRPLKNSTSSMSIRLREKEEYHKLLMMQMKQSRLTRSPLNTQSPPTESDVLSISSSTSSNDVSLLGTSHSLTQAKHKTPDPFSIPQYKTSPRRDFDLAIASSSSPYSQRLKAPETMPTSFSALLARQRKRASLLHQSQNEKTLLKPSNKKSDKYLSQTSNDTKQIVVSDDDDDDICIIEDDETKNNQSPKKQFIQDNDHSSEQKEALSDSRKYKSCLDFRDSIYTRDSYLEEMKKSRLMHSEQWKRQVEDHEIKAKAYEDKRRAQTLGLERQLKLQMRIFEEEPEVTEEIFIEEEEQEEEVLPELTDNMMQVINAALRPSPSGEVLSDGYSLKITRQDMATLSGLNWLNDEIINFYMNMLIDRGKHDGMPHVHAFNTFFYPKIMSGGHSAVKRWTKKVDLFAMDYIIIPVHLGMHWCLCVVNMKNKVISYYDSMGARNQACLVAVLKYLNDESVAKRQSTLNESEWTLETATGHPQQMNGSDCGMFACKYAEYLTREKELSFTQNDMPYFRLRMVYEIVTKKLLQ